MSLDKKSQLPLYAQLMKEIKDQIRKGTYKEGDQIPHRRRIIRCLSGQQDYSAQNN